MLIKWLRFIFRSNYQTPRVITVINTACSLINSCSTTSDERNNQILSASLTWVSGLMEAINHGRSFHSNLQFYNRIHRKGRGQFMLTNHRAQQWPRDLATKHRVSPSSNLHPQKSPHSPKPWAQILTWTHFHVYPQSPYRPRSTTQTKRRWILGKSYLTDNLDSLELRKKSKTRRLTLIQASFVSLPTNNPDAHVQQAITNALQHLGPLLAQALIYNIGGAAARSELDKLSDPLRKLVVSQVRAKSWLEAALIDGNFPSDKVDQKEKMVFLTKVMK